MAVLTDRPQPGVGLPQDPRQALGQLGRDRGPVAPARLTRRQHGVEAGLDHIVARSPRQRPVVGDEPDRTADAVAHGLGVGERDIGLRDPVGVVADARDRRRVRAKRRAEAAAADRWRRRGRERVAPGQVLAEVMGLVGDHDRVARERTRPALGRLGDPRVRDRDPVEPGRGPRRVVVGSEVEPEAVGGARPLPRRGAVGHATTIVAAAPPPAATARTPAPAASCRPRARRRSETAAAAPLPDRQRGQRADLPATQLGGLR